MRRRGIASGALALLGIAAVGEAQTALPRGFVGVGIAAATSDADSRMRLFEDSFQITTIEGGGRLSPRVGVGVELVRPGRVEAFTTGQGFKAEGRQDERVVLGVVRFRAGSGERWGLDVLGGAGVLWQRHEGTIASCAARCTAAQTSTSTSVTLATVGGADVPVRLARHVSVVPQARLYGLHRAHRVSSSTHFISWPFETKPSARLAVGVSGRFTW
jgi:hypothetical protein